MYMPRITCSQIHSPELRAHFKLNLIQCHRPSHDSPLSMHYSEVALALGTKFKVQGGASGCIHVPVWSPF